MSGGAGGSLIEARDLELSFGATPALRGASRVVTISEFTRSSPRKARACRMFLISERQPSRGEFASRKTSAVRTASVRSRLTTLARGCEMSDTTFNN